MATSSPCMAKHTLMQWLLEQGLSTDVINEFVTPNESGIETLDRLIRDMWDQGWDPDAGNLNVFTTHFGFLLAVALLRRPCAAPVFRSRDVLDHLSVWQAGTKREYFPFHMALKCFCSSRGESLQQMLRDASRGPTGASIYST